MVVYINTAGHHCIMQMRKSQTLLLNIQIHLTHCKTVRERLKCNITTDVFFLKLATEPEGRFANTNGSPEGHLQFKCKVYRCILPLSQTVMPEIYGLLKDSRF